MLYEANAGMGMASGPGFPTRDGIFGGLGAYTGCPPGYGLDRVTARCFPMSGLGTAMGPGHAIRDGIFTAFGAAASTNFFNLESPAGLRQFKMALKAVQAGLAASALDLPYWDEGTEMAWKLFINGLQNPAVLATNVNGHLVPTKTGALALEAAATSKAGAAATWPDLTAWAKGFDPQLVPPSNFGGPSTAAMLMWVGGAGVALLLIAVALGGKKRRSRR